MKSLHVWFILFLVVLTLIGCRSPETSATEPQSFVSPLESTVPTATVEPELAIPTLGPGIGVVVGAVEVEGLDEPMSGVPVFLGEPIGSDSDAPLFGLEPSTAPGATTDQRGGFVITDVTPGDYVIILWNPVNSIMARDFETGEPLVISVGAGEVVDIGKLSEPRP